MVTRCTINRPSHPAISTFTVDLVKRHLKIPLIYGCVYISHLHYIRIPIYSYLLMGARPKTPELAALEDRLYIFPAFPHHSLPPRQWPPEGQRSVI